MQLGLYKHVQSVQGLSSDGTELGLDGLMTVLKAAHMAVGWQVQMPQVWV
jgi:hypothetical protein